MNEMRIYVASLSDYNDGRLEGKWFDLADYSDASELMGAIFDMLNEITKKYNDGEVREEWAVHDYEGIPSTLASEYMGEQDFQQLYDIAEVADDRGIPVEVLVERAGDTGSDDYQALADSLMFVVNGNDESDIVYEYEEQLGGLGNDFWSNHIYIDDVTERVLYGEDVDRFRDDILSENPDLDEDEAERQAEEMADEEAERREDLTTYLEDMGLGDEIPNWVSKDYEGAWKRSLSYDFDVIHHDGQMYVFSNNYSLGGTILSGMIGAYIGYQVGKQGLNKVAYKTGEKLGKATRKVKSSVKRVKKKFAGGGGVSYIKNWEVIGINKFGKMFKEKITLGRMSDKEDVKNALRRRTDLNIREITSIKELFGKGGGVYSSDTMYELKVFDGKSNEFLTSVRYRARNQREANEIGQDYEYEMHQKYGDYLRFALSEAKPLMTKGGGIGFKALSAKVAKRYEGKKPSAKYRAEYGKRYSKSEAKEVGDKVAGKVYWSQKNKMALGGKTPIAFKGYTINFINGEYRAEAYGNPQFSDKNLAKLKQKINSYLRGNKFADGGGVENNYNNPAKSTHVLHIDGQNWYLEKIDSTHFYMSNSPDYRGMAHHIGQHKGEPYYEEVREWLKSTFSEGGGISGLNDLIRG